MLKNKAGESQRAAKMRPAVLHTSYIIIIFFVSMIRFSVVLFVIYSTTSLRYP